MKVKVLIGVLVVLMVMNLAARGSFMFMHLHGDRHHGHSGERRMQRWVMRNVPEEDRERLMRTMRSFHEEVRPLAEQTGKLEEELISSMRQDPPPRAHIDSLLEQISHNRLQDPRRATDRMIPLAESLTP